MSNIPVDNDLIERYLLGKLTDEEIHDFLARVENDRELARKFRLIKMFPEMMSEQGRGEYERKLAYAATPVIRRNPFRFMNWRFFVRASILFVVITAIALLYFLVEQYLQKGNRIPEVKEIRKEDNVKPASAPVKDTAVVIPPQPQALQQPENKKIQKLTN